MCQPCGVNNKRSANSNLSALDVSLQHMRHENKLIKKIQFFSSELACVSCV